HLGNKRFGKEHLKMRARTLWLAGFAALALGSAGLVTPAHADVVLSNDANVGTDNVIYNGCDGSPTGTGTTVQGCLNSNHSQYVDFLSSTSLTISGGQASIAASAGMGATFDNLTVEMHDGTIGMTALTLNIDSDSDGTVDVTVHLDGEP